MQEVPGEHATAGVRPAARAVASPATRAAAGIRAAAGWTVAPTPGRDAALDDACTFVWQHLRIRG